MFPSPRTINNLTEELTTLTSHTMQKETDGKEGARERKREWTTRRLANVAVPCLLVCLQENRDGSYATGSNSRDAMEHGGVGEIRSS